MEIEKSQKDICNRLASSINKTSKRFSSNEYKTDAQKYKKALSRDDVSIEKKKKS